MKKSVLTILLALSLLLSGSGVAALAADASTVATIDETGYSTLQAAVDAVCEGTKDGIIVLEKSTTEDIRVSGEVYVDLNGKDIQSVTVESGTFYAIDSATNDYVSKSADDYGTIGIFTGDVQAAFSPEEDGYGYLMFSDNGTNASFHYVELRITDMVLRPKGEEGTTYNSDNPAKYTTSADSTDANTSMGTTGGAGGRDPDEEGEDPETTDTPINPSIYYKCAFTGDEVVEANVESFGVALSLAGEPGKVQLSQCGYSTFTDFTPGADGNTQQSTLLRGIMKETNANFINKRNAGLKVYGQAYLKLSDGSYVFGNPQNRTLREQTELANKLWTVLGGTEKDSIRAMYNRYTSIMQTWNLTGVTKAPYSDYVEDAITWYETYQNIPIANASMTEAELRQICVDYFRTYLSFKWTPNKEFKYLDHEGDWTTLSPGVVFTGMPYCMEHAFFDSDGDGELDKDEDGNDKKYGIGDGSIYKILNYYDPATGVLDTQKMGTPKTVFNTLTGHCTSGLRGAWHRVSDAVKLYTSPHWVPANGVLPIGKYVWNEYETTEVKTIYGADGSVLRYEIVQVDDAISKVIAASTKGVFYSAFAKMQPGDGLVSDGHVMMCTGVEVAYKADGSVDSGNSYIWYIDQNSYGSTDKWVTQGGATEATYTYTQDNGCLVRNLGGMIDDPVKGNKKSFFDMLKAGYIPVTIPEFCTEAELTTYKNRAASYFVGTDREEEWNTVYAPAYDALIASRTVEAGSTTSSNGLESLSSVKLNTLFNVYGGSITANYNVSYYRVVLEDAQGNVIMEEIPAITTSDRTYSIKIKDLLGALQVMTQNALAPYAAQRNHVIKIQLQLVNGECVDALNATLKA